MFQWLKKTKAPTPLLFKDGEAAFAFACGVLVTDLPEGAILPGVVLDAAKEVGDERPPVKREDDGNQTAIIKIASADGGFKVIAGTLSANGPTLRPGDLVAWQAAKVMPGRGAGWGEERSAWIGLILARLKPEYTTGRGWAIDLPFSS